MGTPGPEGPIGYEELVTHGPSVMMLPFLSFIFRVREIIMSIYKFLILSSSGFETRKIFIISHTISE